MNRNQKRIPPSEWSAAWLSAILSAISALDGKHGFRADFWRAYVLVARDTNWTLAGMRSIRFDQIAPDGTVVLQLDRHPVPLIARLSKDSLAAIEPLRASPHPSGQVFFTATQAQAFQNVWQRILKVAGFNRAKDEAIPLANAFPVPMVAPSPPAPVAGEPQSLMQFLEHCYAPLRLGGKSQRTLLLYRISIRNFGRYLEREPMLSDLTDETVAAYLGWLRTKKYAPHTVQKEYCQLTAMWRFACQRRLIELYPSIRKPKAPRCDPRSWLHSDLQKLFKAIATTPGYIGDVPAPDWWRALHYMQWDTAERIGALLSLTWADIDLDGRWVTIRAAYRKGCGEDKTHRLHPDTVAALRLIHSVKRELVFEWPFERSTIFGKFGEILKRAGLPHDRHSKFHRMRRTVATLIEVAGGDATKALGHYDRSVTENHYLDPRLLHRPQIIDLLKRPDEPDDDDAAGAAVKGGGE